ncbi:hypothetical protein [Ligilactobacillus agilis]|nr:hypothetical protein [Ligilactobacillus agilis]
MKYLGTFLVGLSLAQHNFWIGHGLLILGMGLIALKLMMEPWPEGGETDD